MLTKGDKIIAGTGTITPLLTSIWSDHILNDISWLRADTYSWQSGDVYVAAYEHLAAEVDENPLEHDVINGIDIPFHRANDGHKIVVYNHTVPERDQLLTNLLNSSGSAWYYLLDTENHRFKLPRTKFGFTGLRTGAGDYVEAGLPNITGRVSSGSGPSFGTFEGAFYSDGSSGWWGDNIHQNSGHGFRIDASRSNAIYGKSDTVQQPATQMYLYFYVGQFTQTAIEQTAGITTEVMGAKVDKGREIIAFQKPTSGNGYTWYRLYADGWVEQGGRTSLSGAISATNKKVTLPIEMANNGYYCNPSSDANVSYDILIGWQATTSFTIGTRSEASTGVTTWFVAGMAK